MKTYFCKKYPFLSFGGVVVFTEGRYATKDPDKQKIIEESGSFKEGFISVEEVILPEEQGHSIEFTPQIEPKTPKVRSPRPSEVYVYLMNKENLMKILAARGIDGSGKTRKELIELAR